MSWLTSLILVFSVYAVSRWLWRMAKVCLGYFCLTLAEAIRMLFLPHREPVWVRKKYREMA